jgi:hypothetical protein
MKELKKIKKIKNSKCYRPSGMLIHLQNEYDPNSQRSTNHREAQIREPTNKLESSLYNAT